MQGITEHPSHIHVNPFQLHATSHDIGSSYGGYMQLGDWHDTILLNVKSAKMRMLMAHFTGLLTIHCHILFHEDLGMMALGNITGKETDPWWATVKKYAPQDCWYGDRHPAIAYNLTGYYQDEPFSWNIWHVWFNAVVLPFKTFTTWFKYTAVTFKILFILAVVVVIAGCGFAIAKWA